MSAKRNINDAKIHAETPFMYQMRKHERTKKIEQPNNNTGQMKL